MEEGCNSTPAFFKVVLPNSSQKLLIPPAYAKNMKDMIPGRAFLRDILGNMWPVKIVKISEDKLFFRDGWEHFMKQKGVEFGDYLMFYFDGENTFDFKLFGKDGSEKGPSEDNEVMEDDPAAPEEELDIFESGRIVRPKKPFFVGKIRKKSRPNEMYIPFEVINNYDIQMKDNIVLRDTNKKRWKAGFKKWRDGRMWLTRGWKDFRKSHNLTDKDRCIFEFVLDSDQTCSLLDVRVIREGSW